MIKTGLFGAVWIEDRVDGLSKRLAGVLGSERAVLDHGFTCVNSGSSPNQKFDHLL